MTRTSSREVTGFTVQMRTPHRTASAHLTLAAVCTLPALVVATEQQFGRAPALELALHVHAF